VATGCGFINFQRTVFNDCTGGNNMSIELERFCPDGHHAYYPIVENKRTIGLACMCCPKIVKEDMEKSGIEIGDLFDVKGFGLRGSDVLVWDFLWVNKLDGKETPGKVYAKDRHFAEKQIAASYGLMMDWNHGLRSLSCRFMDETDEARVGSVKRKDPRF
jgi:hypothetical protein